MSGPQTLNEHVGILRTKVGAAFPGSRAVFRGHDLHRDLKDLDWFMLCALGIFGRHVPREQVQLMAGTAVYTSYPDARLWNNRVAALAGTTRSTPNLAISAAQAISEATIFGRGNEFRSLDFFYKTQQALDTGTSLADYLEDFLRHGGRLAGYGRPISNTDERMPLTLSLAEKLGLTGGPYLKLAFDIDRYFESTGRPLRMNLSSLLSAFAADFGWSTREFNLLVHFSFLGGMFPCYLEAADKPVGTTFPTRCTDVKFEGLPHRDWPRQA